MRQSASLVRFRPLSYRLEFVTLVNRKQLQQRTSLLELHKTTGFSLNRHRVESKSHNLTRRFKVNNKPNRSSEFFDSESEVGNLLWQYVQSMSPEMISQLSKPMSSEVFQVMERNIVGMLGNLPPEHFGVTVTTSRENLGRLLASAMMSGYFLRNAEQRMTFEKSLQAADSQF